jgi:plasmid maintenance system antidote protein VapI
MIDDPTTDRDLRSPPSNHTVGEILVEEEFMKPIGLTQAALADAWACNASTSMSCATIVVM